MEQSPIAFLLICNWSCVAQTFWQHTLSSHACCAFV